MATTESERLETLCWTLENRLGVPHPAEPRPGLHVILGGKDGEADDE